MDEYLKGQDYTLTLQEWKEFHRKIESAGKGHRIKYAGGDHDFAYYMISSESGCMWPVRIERNHDAGSQTKA